VQRAPRYSRKRGVSLPNIKPPERAIAPRGYAFEITLTELEAMFIYLANEVL